MKKSVYSLFTVENGIRMNASVMDYICTTIKTLDDLQGLLSAFKSRFNTSEINKEQIEQIITNKQEKKELFVIHNGSYNPHNHSEKYDFFRKLMGLVPTPISLLEEGLDSTIYGIVYKGRTDVYVIEDDHGVIEIDTSGCENNAFFSENFLLAARGCLNENKFKVRQLIHPPIIPHSTKNAFLSNADIKICVFGCFVDEESFVSRAVEKYKPDLVVLSLCVKNQSGKDPHQIHGAQILTFPCRCANQPLPNRTKGSAGNPFSLESYDKKIAFVCSDLFQYKAGGQFCNSEPLESFFRYTISQQSYNPFLKYALSLEGMPNIFIIFQEFYPFSIKIDGVQVVSLSSIQSGSFAFINLRSEEIEIVNLN